jgi:hypothetical protein
VGWLHGRTVSKALSLEIELFFWTAFIELGGYDFSRERKNRAATDAQIKYIAAFDELCVKHGIDPELFEGGHGLFIKYYPYMRKQYENLERRMIKRLS